MDLCSCNAQNTGKYGFLPAKIKPEAAETAPDSL
jgi:hypothetical protein